MVSQLISLKKELLEQADTKKAKILQGFFKTEKGEYGEGDIFLGIVVPKQRALAKKYVDIELQELQELLNSKFHEHRLVSLLILIEKYQKYENKKELVDFYLKNTKNINNWDLVDLSAHKILGDYLLANDRSVLYRLAKSENLWERRISIISTFAFIARNQFEDSLKISEMLLNDSHDLIHKAVGWTLREVGKKDIEAEESFLKNHYKEMPRTMLRYAIEKFSVEKKSFYMKPSSQKAGKE